MGLAPEEIVQALPHLTLAAVFDALSYFSDHQDEIVWVHGLEPRRRLECIVTIHRRPVDIGQGDRLAPVERVREPAVDEHAANEPPVLGQTLERNAGSRPDRVRRLLDRRRGGRLGLLLAAQKVERHRYSSAAPLLSRIVSTTAVSANVVVSPSTRPSAMSRSSRRMILPDRVLGRSGTNIRNLGRAIGPMT